MCTYLSAIVFRNGDVLTYDETDSHEHIIAAHRLIDDGSPLASRAWIRVEFTPPIEVDRVTDESAWTLRVDEEGAPDWWEDRKDAIRESLWARVCRSIVTDERKCLIGGVWIILPGAKIREVIGGRIVFARGDGLREADLSRADLFQACLHRADLFGANFEGVDLRRAELRGANLSGANLCRANLSDADLFGADLRDALLDGADIFGADFRDAYLHGARRSPGDCEIEGWVVRDGFLERSRGAK